MKRLFQREFCSQLKGSNLFGRIGRNAWLNAAFITNFFYSSEPNLSRDEYWINK